MRHTPTSTWLTLCTGTAPTDTDVDALTATSAIITSSSAVVFNGSGVVSAINSTSTSTPLWFIQQLPTSTTATSTKVGTLTWGVISDSQYGVTVVDVGLPNSGAVVQVDKMSVTTGTVVSLLSISYSIWR